MITTELKSGWRMRCINDPDWQEASVPGSVYTDLLRNGRIEDPYWKDREDSICALMEEDYEYECRFTPDAGLLQSRTRVLRFEGLDTCASVFLNGRLLGEPCNMHRTWEYDVTADLKEWENVLRVRFHSPLKYIACAYKKYGNIGNEDTYEGFMHLRKAHYMFGWDWGAHLPDAGIFRGVYLLGIGGGRIDSVYIRQRHEDGRVRLIFEAEGLRAAGAGAEDMAVAWTAQVTSPDGKAYRADLVSGPDGADGRVKAHGELIIEDPQLW